MPSPLIETPSSIDDQISTLTIPISETPSNLTSNIASNDDDNQNDDNNNNNNETTATTTTKQTPPPATAEPASEKLNLQEFRSSALRPFVIISSSYLLFTVTDGAIRMIVLMHAYNKGFSAMQVAIMFTLYELAGAFTNLAAGMMGARWGIRLTLICGLSLQLLAYGLLFGWKDEWSQQEAIVYITIAQMFAGIAKDLTKLGGKTVTKLVTPEEQSTKLFRLVSLITGWKNSLKGVGYFLGSALVQVNYYLALGCMMALVVLALPWAVVGLDKNLGTAKKKNATWREIFVMDNYNLNVLSLARLFLFASRDFWFEVPLPFYLRSPGCDGLGSTCSPSPSTCPSGSSCIDTICTNDNVGGGCGGLGLDRVVAGAILGGYIIFYGQIQSWTPQLVTGPLGQTPPNKLTEVLWGAINCLPTMIAAIVVGVGPAFVDHNDSAMIGWFAVIIITFAFIFAVNSSIHSFLVVKYAKADKVAVSVGFYYMSNALGRLFGTIGSGVLYTYVGSNEGEYAGHNATKGLAACFAAGTVCSILAAGITYFIKDDESGLRCGRLVCVANEEEDVEEQQQGGVSEGGKKDIKT